MKIEAGKYYRDGGGKVHGPATPYNDARFKWQLGAYYTDAGGYHSDNRESIYNLVCEVECRDVLPFPLEAGKKYNTTKPDGTPGPVVRLDNHTNRYYVKHFPFCCDIGGFHTHGVTRDGSVEPSRLDGEQYRITSPYVEPKPPTIAERLQEWRRLGVADFEAIIADVKKLEAAK